MLRNLNVGFFMVCFGPMVSSFPKEPGDWSQQEHQLADRSLGCSENSRYPWHRDSCHIPGGSIFEKPHSPTAKLKQFSEVPIFRAKLPSCFVSENGFPSKSQVWIVKHVAKPDILVYQKRSPLIYVPNSEPYIVKHTSAPPIYVAEKKV